MRHVRLATFLAALLVVLSLFSQLTSTTATAQVASDPAVVGQLGPLIPFHKDAIHAGLAWTGDRFKICFWMRPSEYRGSDLVESVGVIKPSFVERVYGGFNAGPLDRSVTTRIAADIPLNNALCLDLSHPDAFRNPGKFDVAALTDADFALNAAAFSNAGHSGGLNYNLFCAGQAALADGRWIVVGGHDKGGNNGIRKINIFNPATQQWLSRPMPPVKQDYLSDPNGVPPTYSPLDENNTDPPLPSDMKYQRWYPTAVTLPDGRVLILSGSDQDTSVGPERASETKVRQVVPEVYDPRTDTTVALEKAGKMFAMYPRSYVVQTGPGKNDWKVAVTAEVQPPLPANVRPYDPFNYNGNTYLFDVLGALANPNVRDEGHWQLVATAAVSHDSGAGAALWELDGEGKARRQRVARFGGDGSAIVEIIDFNARNPKWQRQNDLRRAVTQNNAAVLPDGTVLIVGGRGGGVNEMRYQLYDPNSGRVRELVDTTVPRHDHSTALLLPDASVLVMGGNRSDLVPDDEDAGVPVGQLYYPPYLFKGARPVISTAPRSIYYGEWVTLNVSMSRPSAKVDSVVLVRMGPITHNWDWGNRSVKLAWNQIGKNLVSVRAPAQPGLAVPGDYLLFVVDERGVPSVAVPVRLNEAN
jgi:hypothetical protein